MSLIFIFYLPFRSLTTCPAVLGKAARKEARVMNKFINGSLKKRSWYPGKEISASTLPYHFQPQKGERNFRRISILNKLFMKYISDIMSTGEISTEIAGLRIEISKVKISPDFAVLNVYWVTKGTSIDEEIERTLSGNEGRLKHELTQLRVIGNVPTIQFVKDRSLSKIAEIDSLLAKADFGEDFVPKDPSLNILSDFILSTKLNQIQEKVLEQEELFPEEPLPSMRMDVLGLDHDVIIQKILRSLSKARAPHRHLTVASSQNTEMSTEDEKHMKLEDTGIQSTLQDNEIGVTVQNADLKRYFAKRIALQRKASKIPKNYQLEKELLSNEKGSLNEDEDFDDFEMTDKNSRRLKELEINVDNFDEVENDFDSQFCTYKDNL